MELGWSPNDHNQAASRLHRQGQRNAVSGYYLLAAGTIEEQIARLVDSKATVTGAMFGELDPQGILESIVDGVIGEEHERGG